MNVSATLHAADLSSYYDYEKELAIEDESSPTRWAWHVFREDSKLYLFISFKLHFFVVFY